MHLVFLSRRYSDMSRYWLAGISFAISLVLAFFLFQRWMGPNSFGSEKEVDWHMLAKLDYVTGETGAELKALDGQEVRIPGFMVPLEDNQKNVTQFLLVPSPQACIHVPPPPPNQMVLVTMSDSSAAEVAYGPIWTYGKLKLTTKRTMYGEASFELEGTAIEPYR